MKTKKLLLLVAFLSGVTSVMSQQWEYYKDLPLDVVAKDIDCNNAGTLFMLTNDNRIFYKTVNGNWTEMPISTTAINPKCITVDKTSNFVFYGDGLRSLQVSDNLGLSWNSVSITNPNSGNSEPITVLSNMKNFDMLFGGGYDGRSPYITKYTPDSSEIFYFDAVNESSTPEALIHTINGKLIIGTFNNGIWLSSNADATAFQQTSFSEHNVNKFTEGQSGRVYALGKNRTTNEQFLMYSNDYMNWTSMDLPNATEIYSTIFFDRRANNLWLGSSKKIYKMAVSATTWSEALLNNPEQPVIEIIGDSNNRIYNFSTVTISQRLNNNGSAWNSINNGLTGLINSFNLGDSNKMFITNRNSTKVFTSDSQAAPWTNTVVDDQPIGINSLYSRSNGKIFLMVGNKLKKSIDNGITYADISASLPPNMIYYRLNIGETGDLFLNNMEKLFRSQDDGQTWELLYNFPSSNPEDSATIERVAQDSNGVVYVTMSSLEIFSGIYRVYYSVDGTTWNSRVYFNEAVSGTLGFGLFSKNDKTYVTTGGTTHLFNYTQNGNEAFQAINKPASYPSSATLNLEVNHLGHYYSFREGNFHKSVNQGATWTSLGMPDYASPLVDSYLFDDEGRLYVLGANQYIPWQLKGIYRFSEALDVEAPDGQQNPIAVHPNPAQDILNIETSKAFTDISVYDLLGKKVTGATASSRSIDVSNLSQGLYIVKATDENNGLHSIKFIKE